MARPKTREINDVKKIIDMDKETVKILTIDAINKGLQGFKPNAERILKEAAKKLAVKTN